VLPTSLTSELLKPLLTTYTNTSFSSVLVPGEFDRASLKPSAPASERIAFPSATAVSELPFSSISFFGDLMSYTSTPVLLQTIAAVAVPTAASASASTTPSASSLPEFTGAANGLLPCAILALSVALGAAAVLF
jgi:hypothetical protein